MRPSAAADGKALPLGATGPLHSAGKRVGTRRAVVGAVNQETDRADQRQPLHRASPLSLDGALGGAKELGRDEFLKLLVTKLANQDPLKPTEDTEFIGQLASFSSLEQLVQLNETIEGLTAGQSELVNAQALTLIGKDAVLPGDGRDRGRRTACRSTS